MNNLLRGLRRTCAVLVGIVFFVAGVLKIMDPVGTKLIMESYFNFFHCTFLMPAAGFISITAALFEVFLGAAVIAGIWRRIVAVLTLSVLGVFTVVTLILLIANPEMSCGCFGQAIELTHFQSFLKNVVLCIISAFAFIPFGDWGTPRIIKYVAFGVVALFAVLFMFYSQESLPLQDFTEYSSGSELEDLTFSFRDPYGEYADSLALDGNLLMITAYDPETLKTEEWGEIACSIDNALSNNILPLLLVPSFDGVPVEFSEFAYFSDVKTLMTFNRSNGGVAYISDGMIVNKWTRSGMPADETFAELLKEDPYDVMLEYVTHRRVTFEGGMIAALAILLLI